MRRLLRAGAAIDAIDAFGFPPVYYAAQLVEHEAFCILAEQECVLNMFPNRNRNGHIQLGWRDSILEHLIIMESQKYYSSAEAPRTEDVPAMVDIVIGHVVRRRQTLETLCRTSLDAPALRQLRLSPGKLLDHKASLAISMLYGRVKIPARLKRLSRPESTVYHIPELNMRQAHVLWDAGFRDMNEFDSFGHTALMKRLPFNLGPGRDESLELSVWLVAKGADLSCRQRQTFRKCTANKCEHNQLGHGDLKIFKTDESSGTTALHYLAGRWGYPICAKSKQEIKDFPRKINTLSDHARGLIRTVLTETLHDYCNCACSAGGCTAYAVLLKGAITAEDCRWSNHSTRPAQRARKLKTLILCTTQVLAQLLNVEQPNLGWLRHEMIRFNTFERLRLRHRCCRMMSIDRQDEKVIYKPYDVEEVYEINEEQAEQLEKLEKLVVEFEHKYAKSAASFSEFLDGYWTDRIAEVTSEHAPIDRKVLEKIGVTLWKTGSASTLSSQDLIEDHHELSDDSGASDTNETHE